MIFLQRRSKYSGVDASMSKRLKELEAETLASYAFGINETYYRYRHNFLSERAKIADRATATGDDQQPRGVGIVQT